MVRRIAWYVPRLTAATASLRYRCFIPAYNLARLGVENIFITNKDPLPDFRKIDALIIVKYLKPRALSLAVRAWSNGTPVFVDLCDNIFVSDYRGETGQSWRDILDEMTPMLSGITTTGPYLHDVLSTYARGRVRVDVIADPMETPEDLAGVNATLAALLTPPLGQGPPRKFGRRLLSLSARAADMATHPQRILPAIQRRLARKPPPTPKVAEEPHTPELEEAPPPAKDNGGEPIVLWFGNHGSGHGEGMLALCGIRDALVTVYKQQPFTLRVVSNNKAKFDEHIRPFPIPTDYREWSLDTIADEIRSARVCVLPQAQDEFSLSKSANRTVLALGHGTPVVASASPALAPLHDAIVIDDFEGGLRRYLTDPQKTAADIARGEAIVTQAYSSRLMAKRWRNIITRAHEKKRGRSVKPRK